jgi:hypothetical protein
MLKLSHFSAESEHGPGAIPLFGPADSDFEKVAAPRLLPEVIRYIENLRPQDDAQYVLVNAMGSGEYYGSNINMDYFDESGLIHRPDDWTGNPLVDRIKAKAWPYGFPTFYNAHPFAHHRNKVPSRAFGEVELAAWNPNMHRVELVTRVEKDRCLRFGGQGVWDRLVQGHFPDVSMGTKVPFDLCSLCTDWELFKDALATFDPKKHRHPGQAVLEFHKKLKAKNGVGIRGLSITRKDYCEHARKMPNRILPDGRKMFVHNHFPRMFDISFVFIGADKTAKVMLFIKRSGSSIYQLPSAEVADELGISDPDEGEKTASISDEVLKLAFLGKDAKLKRGEIEKDVVPSQFAGKAVPVLTKREPDLPRALVKLMGSLPLSKTLSTTAGLGMPLKPREFQRIVLIQLGKKDKADEYDRKNILFPKVDDADDMDMSTDDFMPSLARMLLPLLAMRSALAPQVEKRVVIISSTPAKDKEPASSLPSELLRKMGAAYNGYRKGVMDLASHSHRLLGSAAMAGDELDKLASVPSRELFSPLSVSYLQDAFYDELPVVDKPEGMVEESSKNSAPSASV